MAVPSNMDYQFAVCRIECVRQHEMCFEKFCACYFVGRAVNIRSKRNGTNYCRLTEDSQRRPRQRLSWDQNKLNIYDLVNYFGGTLNYT